MPTLVKERQSSNTLVPKFLQPGATPPRSLSDNLDTALNECVTDLCEEEEDEKFVAPEALAQSQEHICCQVYWQQE